MLVRRTVFKDVDMSLGNCNGIRRNMEGCSAIWVASSLDFSGCRSFFVQGPDWRGALTVTSVRDNFTNSVFCHDICSSRVYQYRF